MISDSTLLTSTPLEPEMSRLEQAAEQLCFQISALYLCQHVHDTHHSLLTPWPSWH